MKQNMNNNIKSTANTILVASVTMLLFAYANSFAQTVWEGPTEEAPGGNTPAPLNIGDIEQEKEGPLIINSAGLADLGLVVFGNTDVGGDIYADGDICTRINGDDICLSSLITPVESSFQCSAPVFDSMLYQGNPNPSTCGTTPDNCVRKVGRVVGYRSVSVPASCSAETGCIIKYELYNSKNVNSPDITRYVKFIQSSQANATGGFTWWSEYNKKGKAINGDGTSSNIVAPMTRTLSDGVTKQYLLIRDDRASMTNFGENRPSNYTERSGALISPYDTRTDRGMAVSFCYDTEEVNETDE